MTTKSDKAANKRQPDAEVQALWDQMDCDDPFLIGCLMTIYSFQTEDEKASESTHHDNSMGFNALDAGIMSSFAEFYKRAGFLTPKQLNLARRTMKKYSRQLLEASPIEPRSIKGNGKKSQQKNHKPIKESKTVELVDGKLKVKFSFPKGDPAFKETLALLTLKSLMHWGFDLSSDLEDWHDSLIIDVDTLEPLKPDLVDGQELRPFQELGIAYIEKANGRGIIGDVMGLGKTVQALGWLSLHPEALPALVICPSNVKYNWEREVKKWLKPEIKVRVIEGKFKPVNSPEEVDEDFIDSFLEKDTIYIINYDIISNKTKKVEKKVGLREETPKREEIRGTGWGDFLNNIHMMTVILDEFHYIKNGKALRTKAAKRLAKNADHILALSGTPIINRPVEFFNGIELVNPNIFPSWWYFVHKFCNAFHDGYGLDTSGHSNTDKLHKIMTSTMMIRREKKDVYDQLPKKVRSIVPLPIGDRQDYEEALKELSEFLKEKYDSAGALVEIEKLKQMAVRAKMESAIDWIKDMLDSGEKLIVFADHKFAVDELMDAFPNVAVKIDGSVSANKRMEIVDQFQKDDNIRLFVGSKAAKEGITLDVASNVAFLEFWWDPGSHDQAEDRCYGRLSDPHGANAWYLVALDTIEEEIAELLDKKRKVIGSILDGKPIDSPSVLTELIEAVKERK
jgi:SNF2 family DNA or RNA helicase